MTTMATAALGRVDAHHPGLASPPLLHAPAPIVVDGRRIVAQHILSLTASVLLDCRSQTAWAEALLSYELGDEAGRPFFDLRQRIDMAWLDGRALAPADLAPRDVGEGPAATVRVVDVEQAAGSVHRLRLRYRLGPPLSELGGAYPPVLAWAAHGRVRWSLGMADLFAGRHLEAWFPSNLPFDQFPFRLELRVSGTGVTHALVTNGTARPVRAGHWSITFPAWFSGSSPMLELRPADDLEHACATAALPASGRTVVVEACRDRSGKEDLRAAARRVASLLVENESRFGAFPADRYVLFLHGAAGGMEYAGATTTSIEALEHEVMHSWFARGTTPASHADAWWDEAFTAFCTGGDRAAVPFDFTAPPVRLCSRRPFQRRTPEASYREGAAFFRGVAHLTGVDDLDSLMGALFRARSRRPSSTCELEEHLLAGSGVTALVDAFHRFVYGYPDAVPRPQVRFSTDGPTLQVVSGRVRARLTNAVGAGTCRHFAVVFTLRTPTSSPPSTSRQVRPGVAAVVGFDLRPGESRVVSARLPRVADGSAQYELLASIHARGLHPTPGSTLRSWSVSAAGAASPRTSPRRDAPGDARA